MSPVVLPGLTAAMPRMQRLVGDLDQPLGAAVELADRVHAAGVAVPAVDDQRHVDIEMSPSRSGLGPGMPWQTTWLMEVQIERGKPR